MARRKRALLDDDSDSSAESPEDDLDEQAFEDDDPDFRAERKLFEDPYQRNKRRRVNGKDDAMYGVFGENDEDEGSSRIAEKRLHFTQAPAFVGGEEHQNATIETDNNERIDQEFAMNDSSTQSNEDVSRELSGGGAGPGLATHLSVSAAASDEAPSRSGIGSRAGIGTARPRFDSPANVHSLPGAFGSASRKPQRAFLRDSNGSAPSSMPGTPKLSQEEKRHFDKLQGTLGGKLMAKMGWEAGTGLGASAEGIVTPIESKLRPKPGMGLAFRGFREKTAQSKAEARRRGEVVSDDEDQASTRERGGKHTRREREGVKAWKRPRPAKVKVEHQTYEQIIQNAGQETQAVGVGKIYDATSGELREVSIADISASWTPSTDAMRIPEVRHNLRLIVDAAKGELNGLAREGKTLEERKQWIRNEDTRLQRKVAEETELITRLRSVHLIVDEIKSQSQPSNEDDESCLEAFSPIIDKLVTQFPKEHDRYNLDEIIVGAISPVIRRIMLSWEPLQNPTILVNVFRRWKHSLKISAEETVKDTVDVYGTQSAQGNLTTAQVATVAMTPYESLMWNAWLPKVRSCINNDWSPANAAPAVRLYEAWSGLLPQFIRDNILDQLIIPKVQKAVVEWQARANEPTLQAIVFPWLSHLGPRIEELLDEVKRKLKTILRRWLISNGVPKDILEWKEVIGPNDWDAITLKYILPKLGATLRDEFSVNPRNQNMAALNLVLPWRPIFSGPVFSQLLEAEFFPKWLEVLHVWLIQPKASFEEVAQWYAFWKGVFSQDVLSLPGVAKGFTRGLELMNKAIELGPDAASKLPRPDHEATATKLAANGSRQHTPHIRRTSARATEITFRSIVEEFAASHDLLFIPTGRAHEKSRMPLFKVSHSVSGKGGVVVFILDDAVWAVEGDDYRAISLEEMVLRATKPR